MAVLIHTVCEVVAGADVKVMVASAFTVTVAVAVQPMLFVYVMVVVPGETPATKPVLFTVATAVFDETHGFTAAGVPDPFSCVVAPGQTVNVPVMVGCNTVTVAVA